MSQMNHPNTPANRIVLHTKTVAKILARRNQRPFWVRAEDDGVFRDGARFVAGRLVLDFFAPDFLALDFLALVFLDGLRFVGDLGEREWAMALLCAERSQRRTSSGCMPH